MPASLRFGLGLLISGLVTAVLALGVVYWQRETRLQAMAQNSTNGDVDVGKAAMTRYGCGACHEIPGLAGANGRVGPSLDGFARRAEIAGLLVNQPDALVRWLREPQAVSQSSGMPNQGIGEDEARDIAAYLYMLD